MRITRKFLILAGAAAVLAGGAGIAAASGGGSDSDSHEGPDVAITGAALQKATDAALAETGGGRVTGTEAGDEEGAYEVEVTRADGSQVDVHLDENFAVIGSKADTENSDEGAG